MMSHFLKMNNTIFSLHCPKKQGLLDFRKRNTKKDHFSKLKPKTEMMSTVFRIIFISFLVISAINLTAQPNSANPIQTIRDRVIDVQPQYRILF